MPITDAMRDRHTVRSYLDRSLEGEVLAALEERIGAINAEQGLGIRLMVGDSRAFGPILKLVLAKGVRNYLILAGDDSPELEEKLGYWSAELMLLAQELGLNSWWLGGTFSRKAVAELVPGKRMVGIVALGYGAQQGSPHKSKAAEQVSSYEGEAPAWFAEGVEAALLAPTAMNRQAFMIEGRADEVSISYAPGPFADADLGIVKYFFEQGAGRQSFRWA